MTDTEALESELLAHRPQGGLEGQLDDAFVWPHYGGHSIAEVPSTVAVLLGADPVPGMHPLEAALWQPLADGVERVVLLLIDAVGWCRLGEAMNQDPELPLHRWRQRGLLAPLTSVFPSTTAVALTTFWTGVPPVRHGMVGSRVFLREFGALCHLLWFTPVVATKRWLLLDWGLEPETFVPVPGFAEHLATAGVPTYALIHAGLEKSALSQVHYRGVVELQGYLGLTDMLISLRELLESRTGERFYAAAYWGIADGLAHRYGPEDERMAGELRAILYGLERELLSRLSPRARRGTLFILTSDHGQHQVREETTIHLQHHPDLREALRMDPGGELRAPYLYAADREAVRGYVAEHLSAAFACLDAVEALEAGLFGPGRPMSEVERRLGDFILPARGDPLLYWPQQEPDVEILGRHGGLSAEEMLVPWLAMRLDR